MLKCVYSPILFQQYLKSIFLRCSARFSLVIRVTVRTISTGIYLYEINNGTVIWHRPSVCIVNFENISHIALVFALPKQLDIPLTENNHSTELSLASHVKITNLQSSSS